MLCEDLRVNRTHSGHRGVAQEQGIQASIDGYADVHGRFRTVRARSVIAPIGGVPIGIDQSELEESLSVKGLSVDRHLSRIIEDGGYGMKSK
ncbi:MAG: hypothetical protein VXY50_03060 [Verrucomicrobiota bacterium]|nr:hypothetical protein [Verrucomicrobiota bacterium]